MMEDTLKVLVVGDHAADLQAVEAAVRGVDGTARLHRVGDAEALADALGRESWDAVLLDQAMPAADFARCLERARREAGGVPLIALADAPGAAAAGHPAGPDFLAVLPRDDLFQLGFTLGRARERCPFRRAGRGGGVGSHCDLAQFRVMVEQVPLAAAMFDRDLNYLAVSDRWLAEMGQRRSELIGRNHYDCVPDLPEAWKEAHRAALAGESLHEDGALWRRADGSLRWRRWWCYPWRGRDHAIGGIIVSFEDITERKNLEAELAAKKAELEELVASRTEALRQSERDVRTILDNMPAMIGYWDRDLRNRFANRNYRTWFGVDPDWLAGRHIRELLGERLFQLNLPYMEAALRGEPQYFERAIPVPHGDAVRHSQAHYIPDVENGEVRGFYVLVSDVSRLKQAESALRDSEERLRAIFDILPVGVALTDRQGQVIDCNEEALRLLGLPRDEFLARDLASPKWLFLRSDGSPLPLEDYVSVRALREQRAVQDVEVGYIAGDLQRWFSVSAMPIERPGYGVVIAFVDVTERRHAEAQRALLAAVVDSSNSAIIAKTVDGTITSWNAGAERLFGYTAEEVVGGPIDILVPPERVIQEREVLHRIVSGLRMEHFESERLCKDGSRIEAAITLSPIRNDDGDMLGVSIIASDISQQRLLEDERRAMREHIEKLARQQMVVQTLAGLAHKFNQPITAIGFYLESALNMVQSGPVDHDRMSQWLLGAANGVQVAGQVLRQMFQQVKKPVSEVMVDDLNALVERCAREQAGRMGGVYPIVLDLWPGVIAAQGTVQQIELIVDNLVRNSSEAMRNAGVPAGAGRIVVETAVAGDMALVSVSDLGPGVPEELCRCIFDPFFSTKDEGIGMGLAISRSLAEAQGGRLWCEPVQSGAKFNLMVPLAK
jgi:PAS domain S-box-containing protein